MAGPPIEPFAIPAIRTTPVLSVRAQWLPVDKVSIVQIGSQVLVTATWARQRIPLTQFTA